jgi:hypothetical protein
VPLHGGLTVAELGGSLELGRVGIVVHGSSLWRYGEQEEDEGVLTSGGEVTELGRRQ